LLLQADTHATPCSQPLPQQRDSWHRQRHRHKCVGDGEGDGDGSSVGHGMADAWKADLNWKL